MRDVQVRKLVRLSLIERAREHVYVQVQVWVRGARCVGNGAVHGARARER